MHDAALAQGLRRARFEGKVIDPAHGEYDKARRVWNGLVDRRPVAIIRPAGITDVQQAVRLAAEAQAPLAIRCGGHSFPGHSTCDAGIVLDLSAMRGVTVDRAALTAEVAGGALLGDLDKASAALGLVTPAGVVSHTGVAGLTLGGGMGWLSRRLGLTIDSLLGADIVTADGRLVRTSTELEPDLFWGIRGGGGNFGVVTSFRFRTHLLGPVAVGQWAYAAGGAAGVLSGYRDLVAGAPRELTTAFTITRSEIVISALWSGAPDHAEKILARFATLGRPVSVSLGGMTFLELQQRSDDHFSWGRRYYAKGGYLDEIHEGAIGAMTESIAIAPTPHSEIYVLQLGGAISDVAEEATPYTGRGAGHYWIVEPVWDSAADDERCIAWGRRSAAKLAAMSLAGNYINEQSEIGKEMTHGAYGPEKYDRLARLKHRYDPFNLFRLNQNIEARG
ncbi:MAG TPA: FAD-binding oxidoreductase [Dongiaceae bacterium]|nr:FAD-binding oxidoreductase [Dongiaceae bacterium]